MSNDDLRHDRAYQQDKLTAKAGDEQARKALAARMDVRPEILYFLAEDDSPDVRRELASNMATPRQADLILAQDGEDAVRADLAGKVRQLIPDLDLSAHDKVHQMTVTLLETLARDQVTRVRQILSETLRDVVEAPPHVINQLARDAELVVAEPVLTFSPVLTDEDLLDIISNGPIAGALGAIAGRNGVAEPVADAVIEADDIGAIALLLGNASAQIREEALDDIIDRAAEIADWHLPLVKRPKLPEKAALRLARFVANSLVKMLLARGDISEAEVEEINSIVDERIVDGSLADSWEAAGPAARPAALVDVDDLRPGEDDGKPKNAAERAATMHAAGELSSAAVGQALEDGDDAFAIAAVAKLSGIASETVELAADSGDPEAVIAVCHAAGLPASMLVSAQRLMGGISISDALQPDGDAYPLDGPTMKAALTRLRTTADATD